MKASITIQTVGRMQDFQSGGQGFEVLWNDIGPFVEEKVRHRLRKRLVTGRFGGDDEDAVGDATQHVAMQLLGLPKKDSARWFDTAKGQGGPAGLKGWLFGFCRTAVAEYCDKWHNAKPGCKVIAESFLSYNELTEADSIVKSAVAKVEADDAELRTIMNECVELLDEPLRTMLRLNVWEGLSERAIEKRLGIDVSTVHHRLVKARSLLRPLLEARGIDASWLAA